MTTIIDEWAAQWGVPLAAVHDLRHRLTPVSAEGDHGTSEAAVTQQVCLEAGQKHVLFWRNNVGAMEIEGGRWLRWGLLNESSRMNERYKSSDRIGLRPLLITPAHVGKTIGQFVAREIKHAGWKWSGSEREVAQRNFHDLVISRGGDACFASGRGTL